MKKIKPKKGKIYRLSNNRVALCIGKNILIYKIYRNSYDLKDFDIVRINIKKSNLFIVKEEFPKEEQEKLSAEGAIIEYKKIRSELYNIDFDVYQPTIKGLIHYAQWYDLSEEGKRLLAAFNIGLEIQQRKDCMDYWTTIKNFGFQYDEKLEHRILTPCLVKAEKKISELNEIINKQNKNKNNNIIFKIKNKLCNLFYD